MHGLWILLLLLCCGVTVILPITQEPLTPKPAPSVSSRAYASGGIVMCFLTGTPSPGLCLGLQGLTFNVCVYAIVYHLCY